MMTPCSMLGLGEISQRQQQWTDLKGYATRLRNILARTPVGYTQQSFVTQLNTVERNFLPYGQKVCWLPRGVTINDIQSGRVKGVDCNRSQVFGGTAVYDFDFFSAYWDKIYKDSWETLTSMEYQLAQQTGIPTLTTAPPTQPIISAPPITGSGTGGRPYDPSLLVTYDPNVSNVVGPNQPIVKPKSSGTVKWVVGIALAGAAAFALTGGFKR